MGISLALLAAIFLDPPAGIPALNHVQKVLVLGDSITYAGGYVDALDAYVRRRSKTQQIEFINIGLPSETVSGLTEPNHAGGAFPRPDLHERLNRALDAVKPDLVLACYGMNDGIYQPYSNERFDRYAEGIRWLRDSVRSRGISIWLMTPPPFDPQPIRSSVWPAGKDVYPSEHPFEGYDEVLAKYSDWLVSQRRHGWKVIDVHTPLDRYLADHRKTDPSFALTSDGVHEEAEGHRLMATEILKAWGAPPETIVATGDRFQSLIHQRQRILTDAWLTSIGHKRPGMPTGLPLPEAEAKARAIEEQISALP